VRHQGPVEAAADQSRGTGLNVDVNAGIDTQRAGRLDAFASDGSRARVARPRFIAADFGRTSARSAAGVAGAGSRRPQPVSAFDYRGGVLAAEGVSLADIADRYGTPCFVYSRAALEDAFRTFDGAFGDAPRLVCYAMKANSSLAILIVFSGVGKTIEEMRQALQAGIYCFNVESASELEHLDATAKASGRRAPISIRVNPDVDPGTHPYISTGLKESKFGVALDEALPLYRRAAGLANVEVRGIDMHIGSQIVELAPHLEAAAKVLALVDLLAAEGIRLEHIDFGGGLGIRYRDEETVDPHHYALAIRRLLGTRPLKLLFEPGRLLVGNAGVLLTRVSYLKPGRLRNFAVVDAAMNDLLRPALYDAWHDIVPLSERRDAPVVYDVVGPVCESGDFLDALVKVLPAEPVVDETDAAAAEDGGRLLDGDELELQLEGARGGGYCRWRIGASGASARDHRGAFRARIFAA